MYKKISVFDFLLNNILKILLKAKFYFFNSVEVAGIAAVPNNDMAKQLKIINFNAHVLRDLLLTYLG